VIVQAANPEKPHLKARHFVVCTGCVKNGPVVRKDPGKPGAKAAIAAAKKAGWKVHWEPRVSPVRKRGLRLVDGAVFLPEVPAGRSSSGRSRSTPAATRRRSRREPAGANRVLFL
jgi:hypothetical protein